MSFLTRALIVGLIALFFTFNDGFTQPSTQLSRRTAQNNPSDFSVFQLGRSEISFFVRTTQWSRIVRFENFPPLYPNVLLHESRRLSCGDILVWGKKTAGGTTQGELFVVLVDRRNGEIKGAKEIPVGNISSAELDISAINCEPERSKIRICSPQCIQHDFYLKTLVPPGQYLINNKGVAIYESWNPDNSLVRNLTSETFYGVSELYLQGNLGNGVEFERYISISANKIGHGAQIKQIVRTCGRITIVGIGTDGVNRPSDPSVRERSAFAISYRANDGELVYSVTKNLDPFVDSVALEGCDGLRACTRPGYIPCVRCSDQIENFPIVCKVHKLVNEDALVFGERKDLERNNPSKSYLFTSHSENLIYFTVQTAKWNRAFRFQKVSPLPATRRVEYIEVKALACGHILITGIDYELKEGNVKMDKFFPFVIMLDFQSGQVRGASQIEVPGEYKSFDVSKLSCSAYDTSYTVCGSSCVSYEFKMTYLIEPVDVIRKSKLMGWTVRQLNTQSGQFDTVYDSISSKTIMQKPFLVTPGINDIILTGFDTILRRLYQRYIYLNREDTVTASAVRIVRMQETCGRMYFLGIGIRNYGLINYAETDAVVVAYNSRFGSFRFSSTKRMPYEITSVSLNSCNSYQVCYRNGYIRCPGTHCQPTNPDDYPLVCENISVNDSDLIKYGEPEKLEDGESIEDDQESGAVKLNAFFL